VLTFLANYANNIDSSITKIKPYKYKVNLVEPMENQPRRIPQPEDTEILHPDGHRLEDPPVGEDGPWLDDTAEIFLPMEDTPSAQPVSQGDRAAQTRQTANTEHNELGGSEDDTADRKERIGGIRNLVDELAHIDPEETSVKVLSRSMISLRYKQRFKHGAFRDKDKSIVKTLRGKPLEKGELKMLSQTHPSQEDISGSKVTTTDGHGGTKDIVVTNQGIYENFHEISRGGGRMLELAVDQGSFKAFDELADSELGNLQEDLGGELTKHAEHAAETSRNDLHNTTTQLRKHEDERTKIDEEIQKLEHIAGGADPSTLPRGYQLNLLGLRRAKETVEQKIEQATERADQLRTTADEAHSRAEQLKSAQEQSEQERTDEYEDDDNDSETSRPEKRRRRIARALGSRAVSALLATKEKAMDAKDILGEKTLDSIDIARVGAHRAKDFSVETGKGLKAFATNDGELDTPHIHNLDLRSDTIKEQDDEAGGQPAHTVKPSKLHQSKRQMAEWRRNRAEKRARKHLATALEHPEDTKAHKAAVKRAQRSGRRAESMHEKATRYDSKS
jgi:hypothetical protein